MKKGNIELQDLRLRAHRPLAVLRGEAVELGGPSSVSVKRVILGCSDSEVGFRDRIC